MSIAYSFSSQLTHKRLTVSNNLLQHYSGQATKHHVIRIRMSGAGMGKERYIYRGSEGTLKITQKLGQMLRSLLLHAVNPK